MKKKSDRQTTTLRLTPKNRKNLKLLGVHKNQSSSDLANEAIEDLVKKYK